MSRFSARKQWAAFLRDGAARAARPAAPLVLSAARQPFAGIVLGIDPSLRGTGLAVLRFAPPQTGAYLASETVIPPKGAGLPECLGCIAAAMERLLERHRPAAVAVEETIYVQNFRTAQKLGAARGAAIGQAARRGLPVFEYPPLRVKQAVAGYGRASKEQVARQVAALLGLPRTLPPDESDAAAVALCHAFTLGRTRWPG